MFSVGKLTAETENIIRANDNKRKQNKINQINKANEDKNRSDKISKETEAKNLYNMMFTNQDEITEETNIDEL